MLTGIYNQRKLDGSKVGNASKNGYRQVSYLRQVDESGRVNVSFIMGTSRVVPLKQVLVPRL